MALAQYDQLFWFPSGELATSVTARVFQHETNTLATLYADAGGTVPLANPLSTSGAGRLAFFVEEGLYWVHIDSESFEIAVGAAAESATLADITAAVAAHNADTTDVHGIPATADLETQAGAQTKANTAQSAATSAAATDATNKVSAHSLASDPHGDRADAAAKYLAKTGGTLTGDLNLDGANLTLQRADDTGGFRFRVTGGALDLEIAGLDVIVSKWANADFSGAQSNVMRWEAAGPHLIGNTQFGTGPFDAVHSIDAGTGVAAVGAKNSLANIRFCGRRVTTGAPTTGAWATGDTVQDAAGALWICTAGGSPGTWTGGGAQSQPWLFDVTANAYGAKGDAKVIADGAISAGSAVLTSASNGFAGAAAGMYVSVKGAAAAGVTTHVAQIASVQNDGQVTLNANAATTVTGAVVIFGTDDTAAIQAAVDAAETYLASHSYAQVYFPPRPYIVAGALSTAKSGNGQITFGVYATTGNKKILEFRGEGDGAAAVRHWEQTVPQHAGSCLISLGLYSSTTAQINDLNANGNPAVISGPNEGTSNGLAYGASARFSNVMPVLKNLAILTSHSSFGLTYGAFNFYGCANAHLENVGYGTAGTVASPSTDYTSPGTFGTGLSVGGLLPAPGNNDLVVARNISCGGGYTYALFATEHLVCDRLMILYCWAALCVVGNYAGSVGSVHALDIISASIEACINEVYIVGAGSAGVGPTIYAGISTESSTPNIGGNSTAALNSALGLIRLTGLFTESGVSVQAPTGIEIVNGQVPRAIKRKTGAFTASPIDRTLICDTSGGAFTGTLPAADFNPVEYTFKCVGASDLTVATTGGQLIYTSSGTGATTATVTTGQTLRVQAMYNGSSWGWYAV